MFTINDLEGELADYIVLNDSKKRSRSVCPEFRQHQFSQKENKPNTLKCRFKTNKLLTAVKETKHTITKSEEKTIHKKLASKPITFQLSRKPEERRKLTNRCRRGGNFCQGDFCDTHKRVYGISKSPQEPCSVTPYRQCRTNDPHTVILSQLMQKRTLENHKKNETPLHRKHSRRKTTLPKQTQRYLPHRSNVVPATVRVQPRGKINDRSHRYAQPLLPTVIQENRKKDENQQTDATEVEISVKETSATHTRESTESQKARKNRVVLHPTDNAAQTIHIR